jgi:hypothetical protein
MNFSLPHSLNHNCVRLAILSSNQCRTNLAASGLAMPAKATLECVCRTVEIDALHEASNLTIKPLIPGVLDTRKIPRA